MYNPSFAGSRQGSLTSSKPRRRCENCKTDETPSWRKCKDDGSLLCNACGLYYFEHKRHRPFRTKPDGRTRALRVASNNQNYVDCEQNLAPAAFGSTALLNTVDDSLAFLPEHEASSEEIASGGAMPSESMSGEESIPMKIIEPYQVVPDECGPRAVQPQEHSVLGPADIAGGMAMSR